MNQIFNIRDTETTDLPKVLELNQAALPHVSTVGLTDMEHFAHTASYFRIIEVDDQIAGFLIALKPGLDYQSANYLWFSANFDDFCYIDRVVITDLAQGNGLGSALYKDVIAFARDLAPRLTCEVNTRPPNPQSMAFHDRFGFKPVGRQQTEGGSKEVSLLSLDLG